jgi:hypothetical protein
MPTRMIPAERSLAKCIDRAKSRSRDSRDLPPVREAMQYQPSKNAVAMLISFIHFSVTNLCSADLVNELAHLLSVHTISLASSSDASSGALFATHQDVNP